MRQLTGLDAAFLQLETSTTPMHIAGLSLYDPSGSPHERLTLAAALDFLSGRLHLAPADRSRPLWEITFIDGVGGIAGLPADSYGVVSKIHHAAIDGVSERS